MLHSRIELWFIVGCHSVQCCLLCNVVHCCVVLQYALLYSMYSAASGCTVMYVVLYDAVVYCCTTV